MDLENLFTQNYCFHSWLEVLNEKEDNIESYPTKSKPIEVSYVNFNRTKPNQTEKYVGDGSSQASAQVKVNAPKIKGSVTLSNGQNDDLESSATEKNKTKRQSKHMEIVKQLEGNVKNPKKLKKV